MDNLTVLVLSFLASLLLLVLVLGFLYYFHKKEKELRKKETALLTSYEEILLKAHNKEIALLEKATEKADHMLLDTEYIQQGMRHNVEQTLQQATVQNSSQLSHATQDMSKAFSQAVEEVKIDYIAHLKQMNEQIKQATEIEFRDYMNTLRVETIQSQEYMGKKITEEFEKIKKELEDYKSRQFTRLDAQLYKVLQKVASEVLDRTITVQEHEKLVVDALEKAKKEGLFDQ